MDALPFEKFPPQRQPLAKDSGCLYYQGQSDILSSTFPESIDPAGRGDLPHPPLHRHTDLTNYQSVESFREWNMLSSSQMSPHLRVVFSLIDHPTNA